MTGRVAVTEGELLRALRADTAIDEEVPPDAATVSELCKALGLGPNAVQRRLARYRAQGRLKEYRVLRYDAQGRRHPCAAYVLLPEPKPSAKPKRA